MCAQKSDISLRQAVGRKIRRTLDDVVWGYLYQIRQEYQEEILEESEEESVAYIAGEAQGLMELLDHGVKEREAKGAGQVYTPGTHQSGPDGNEPVQSRFIEAVLDDFYSIDEDSRLVLRATSAYLESMANQLPEVERCREEVLNGDLLGHEQAVALLNSYVARFLSPKELSEYDIPLTGHTATVEKGYERVDPEHTIDHRVTLRVEHLEERTLRLRYTEREECSTIADIIRCEVQDGVLRAPYNIPLADTEMGDYDARESETNMGPMMLANVHTPHRPSEVWPGSLVDKVYSYAHHLISRQLAEAFKWPSRQETEFSFDWWDEHAAAEFLLTGVAPLIQPMKARVTTGRGEASSIRRVELDVSPWVSESDVSRAYKRAQSEVSKKQRSRRPSSTTCEVVIFVLERKRVNSHKKISWTALCEEWNSEHPDRRFKDYRHLRTYFERGRKWIKDSNFSLEGDE